MIYAPNERCEAGQTSRVSLRDYFAGHVLAGLLANPQQTRITAGELARLAYVAADAMLKQREARDAGH